MNLLCWFGFHKWVAPHQSFFSDYEKRHCTCCGERQVRSGPEEDWYEY